MDELTGKERVMAVSCTYCNHVIHVCCEPECYSDKDWLNSLKRYAKDNWLKVDVISLVEFHTLPFGSQQCCKTGIMNKIEVQPQFQNH